MYRQKQYMRSVLACRLWCVSMWEKERGGERERARARKREAPREIEGHVRSSALVCVYICVYLHERIRIDLM